jgi:hypothetical protein
MGDRYQIPNQEAGPVVPAAVFMAAMTAVGNSVLGGRARGPFRRGYWRSYLQHVATRLWID